MKTIHEKVLPIIRLNTLTWLAASLKSVFVDLFIWKQTQAFSDLVVFNASVFIALFAIYPLTGIWLKKYSARTLIKLGNLLAIISLAFIIVLQKQSINFLIPIGLITGFGAALFWAGFNLHQYLATHKQDRDFFFGVQDFWAGIARVISPVIAGFVVFGGNRLMSSRPFLGYYLLFFLICLVMLISTIEAWFFPRYSAIEFKISQFKQIWQKNPNFKFILFQQFSMGLRDVSTGTILSMLLITILQQELNVGIYNSILGLLIAIAAFLCGKMLTSQNRVKLSLIGATSLFTGAIILAFKPTVIGLILYGVSFFPAAFLSISIGTIYLSAADSDPSPWRYKYIYLVSRDFFLGLGRVLSYIFLWTFFSYFPQSTAVKIWMIISGILALITWLFIKSIHLQSKNIDKSTWNLNST